MNSECLASSGWGWGGFCAAPKDLEGPPYSVGVTQLLTSCPCVISLASALLEPQDWACGHLSVLCSGPALLWSQPHSKQEVPPPAQSPNHKGFFPRPLPRAQAWGSCQFPAALPEPPHHLLVWLSELPGPCSRKADSLPSPWLPWDWHPVLEHCLVSRGL